MSKENFKIFAKKHPELAKTVLTGKTSWQKLYELYDIYGENSSVWDDLLDQPIIKDQPLKDLFNNIRNIDMDSLQKGVSNIQKTIGMIQEIGLNPKKEETNSSKPLYTYFDD